MTKKTVHIVGAGLSGMVAAVNLARAGHEVIVLEQAKRIGGLRPHHPSNHSTPINLDLIRDYVGIDIRSRLVPRKVMYTYAAGRKYRVAWTGYSIERGPRKTSLDHLLYETALEAGVRFEFDRKITDPADVPDPAILATGLFREMCEALERPCVRLPCFSTTRKVTDPDRQGEIRSWLGTYTNTYGYAPIVNGLDYILLFSDRDLSPSDLERFEEELDRTEGIRVEKWDAFDVYVPLGRPDAPRLFAGRKILAGTLAGMMEPGAYFGIHGALVSGRIAARAIDDPEGALEDFKRFNRYFRMSWYLNRPLQNPLKFHFFNLYFRLPWLFTPFIRLTDRGIPGIDHHSSGMNPVCVGTY